MFWRATCLLLSGICAHAAAPSLDCFYPLAVPRGTTNTITAVGKFDPWPPKFWTTAAGLSFDAETNKGKLRIEVKADAKPGPYFVRAYNEQGASAVRFLLITEAPEAAESEPNNDLDGAQKLETLPAIVNGRFDKGDDVDTYRVHLDSGQTLVASVDSYVLASPVDAVLRLLDARGVEVAFNHDDGRTLDPELAYTAPRAGNYFLQAFGFNYPADSNIRFAGNDKCVYRLHVSAGACPKPEQAVAGCLKETEPNNTCTNAMAVQVPCAISGCIDSCDDEDVFKFTAKKDEKLVLKIESAKFGFPLDARLGVRNEKQDEVAKADDSGSADPMLDWSPGNDGTFFAVIRNVLHRGGPDHVYRLSIQHPEPSLKATVGEHAFSIEPGKTNKIKVTLKRLHGFDAKLTVSVEGLPEGVQCEPVEADSKATEATLSVTASSDAKPCSGPIRILAKDSNKMYLIMHDLTTLGENNGVPNGYSRLLIDAVEDLWFTVSVPAKK
jgi:hypothetical protein